MTSIITLWAALAAIGAGTIHLAVGAGAPVLLAIVLVGFGIAELGWGVATLARGRFVAASPALFGALIPVLVWAATATLGSGLGLTASTVGLPLHPMLVASLFNLFLAGSLAVLRRPSGTSGRVTDAGSRPTADASPAQGWRFIAALILGGVLFSGLTTPALAATEAGTVAVPHGSHGTGHDH